MDKYQLEKSTLNVRLNGTKRDIEDFIQMLPNSIQIVSHSRLAIDNKDSTKFVQFLIVDVSK